MAATVIGTILSGPIRSERAYIGVAPIAGMHLSVLKQHVT